MPFCHTPFILLQNGIILLFGLKNKPCSLSYQHPQTDFMKCLSLFILLISFNCSFAQDIQSGRVAYYPFNGNADDQVGNKHGIVYGPALISDRFGNINSAYQFDGVNDFIEIKDNFTLDFGADNDFTISLWTKIAENQRDKRGNNNEILGKWNAYNYTGYPYAIRYWNENATSSNQNKIFTLRYDSENCANNPTITGSCQISTEEWHHIIMRKQGNEVAYFQDGALLGTIHDNTEIQCNTRNDNPVFIGKRDLNTRYFTGAIDDISFYNRALTVQEIKSLLKEGQWSPPTSSFKAANFNSFSFSEQTAPANIDKEAQTIELKVSCSSDLTKLIAHFSLPDGAYATVDETTQISGRTSNDFTNPVKYVISNKNACSQQEWTVFVRQEKVNSEAEFLSFNLPAQTGPAYINKQTHTIELKVSCSTNLSSLVAEFTLPKNTNASVNGTTQISGNSSNNFTSPLKYLIKDNTDCFEQEWTIIVKHEEFSDSQTPPLRAFNLPNQMEATIIDSASYRIELSIPCSSDIYNLAPIFTLKEGYSATVSDKLQHSGTTTNDFSSPVVYHITNADICFEQTWTVFVEFSKTAIDAETLVLKNFFIPNVITPNGDGINDSFVVGDFFYGSYLSIFNRFGRKVYQTSFYKNEFNGIQLSAGVYFYSIQNDCIEKPLTGYVTIIKP